MTEEKEVPDLLEIKRLPMWLQLTICSTILLLVISWGVLSIGTEEFNKRFCEERLDLMPNEKAALWEDQKTKAIPITGERKWGCCRVPDGAKKLNTEKMCRYTPEYKIPGISQKVDSFLKRFIY